MQDEAEIQRLGSRCKTQRRLDSLRQQRYSGRRRDRAEVIEYMTLQHQNTLYRCLHEEFMEFVRIDENSSAIAKQGYH